MKISIHTNTQKPIGKLTEELVKDASEVFVASAYISDPAVKILLGQINSANNSLAKSVDLLFGFDLVTSTSALDQIVKAAEERPEQIRAKFVPHKSGRLFHPKVYYFRVGNLCHIINQQCEFDNGWAFLE